MEAVAPAARLSIEADYLEGEELAREVIENGILKAKESIWLATANLKDVRVHRRRLLSMLVARAMDGMEVRLLHAGKPSRPALETLNGSGAARVERFSVRKCVRVHFKAAIVDGTRLYLGSANLTGAGLGMKSPLRRNFEVGLWTRDEDLIREVVGLFSAIWNGVMCEECGRKEVCGEPLSPPWGR